MEGRRAGVLRRADGPGETAKEERMGTPAPTTPRRPVRGAARLLRGTGGAAAITTLAAALHSAATAGPLPGVGLLLFSAVLAAPLCTLLAGRALSLWRTAAAVAGAQGLYHGLYALSGGAHAVSVAPGVGAAHAGHVTAGAGGRALVVHASGAASDHAAGHGPGMLAAHVLAAVLTVAVLRHGERMVVAVAERVLEATPLGRLLVALAHVVAPAPRSVRRRAPRRIVPAGCLVLLGSPGLRGPPALALAA